MLCVARGPGAGVPGASHAQLLLPLLLPLPPLPLPPPPSSSACCFARAFFFSAAARSSFRA
jgi:hypothetical protein